MTLRLLTALGACAILSGCAIDPYYDAPTQSREPVRAQSQSQSRYPDSHYQTYRPGQNAPQREQYEQRPPQNYRQDDYSQPNRYPRDDYNQPQAGSRQPQDYRPQPVERTPDIDTGPTRPTPSTGRASRDQGNSASNNLLQQAAQARAQGDYAGAQRLAERAQSIAPQDAASYAELARIYRAQGDSNRAQQMARRGLSMGSTNPNTIRELELLSR